MNIDHVIGAVAGYLPLAVYFLIKLRWKDDAIDAQAAVDKAELLLGKALLTANDQDDFDAHVRLTDAKAALLKVKGHLSVLEEVRKIK